MSNLNKTITELTEQLKHHEEGSDEKSKIGILVEK